MGAWAIEPTFVAPSGAEPPGGGEGEAVGADAGADVGDLDARVAEDGQRAEAAEQPFGRDDERAVAGGEPGADGERPGGGLEHELAGGVLDRAHGELAGKRRGEVAVGDRRLPREAVVVLVERGAAELERADLDAVDVGVEPPD